MIEDNLKNRFPVLLPLLKQVLEKSPNGISTKNLYTCIGSRAKMKTIKMILNEVTWCEEIATDLYLYKHDEKIDITKNTVIKKQRSNYDMSENNQKLISLFNYIKELFKQRTTVISDLKKQLWYKFMLDIPKNENIKINFADRTDEDVDTEGILTILSVKKIEYEELVSPHESIKPFLEEGYDKFLNQLKIKDNIEIINSNNEVEIINFESDEKRKKEYLSWKYKRDEWIIKQKEIQKVSNRI